MSKQGQKPVGIPGQTVNPYGAQLQYAAQPPPYTQSQAQAAQLQYAQLQQQYANAYNQQAMGQPQMVSVTASPYVQGYTTHSMAGAPPPYTAVTSTHPQLAALAGQPQTYYYQNLYDAGARFDGVSRPVIPPPPPGVAPTAAQMAAMQGHAVIGSQQRSDYFTGGSGSGMTFW